MLYTEAFLVTAAESWLGNMQALCFIKSYRGNFQFGPRWDMHRLKNTKREIIDICGHELELINDDDKRCIEQRQLEHHVSAVLVGSRCRYGFPQAFAFHPVEHNVSSGLCRLSCPLLVKAIDEWECNGAITEFNRQLNSNEEWQNGYRAANQATACIRKYFVNNYEGGYEKILDVMSESSANHLLDSGIAGVTPTLLDDVKCLHAHLADHLCRGGSSVKFLTEVENGENLKQNGSYIGKKVLRGLVEQNIPVSGSKTCWQQCDVRHQRTPDSWHYTPVKNKQKLRTAKRRRELLKKEKDVNFADSVI